MGQVGESRGAVPDSSVEPTELARQVFRFDSWTTASQVGSAKPVAHSAPVTSSGRSDCWDENLPNCQTHWRTASEASP